MFFCKNPGDTLMSDTPERMKDTAEYKAFAEFAELLAVKRDIQLQLGEVQSRLDSLEPILLTYLAERGEPMHVEGYVLYMQRNPWVRLAQGVSKPMLVEALKASGLKQYVFEDYKVKELTKYVKDLEVEHADELRDGTLASILALLPAALQELIRIEPSFHVHSRAGAKK